MFVASCASWLGQYHIKRSWLESWLGDYPMFGFLARIFWSRSSASWPSLGDVFTPGFVIAVMFLDHSYKPIVS